MIMFSTIDTNKLTSHTIILSLLITFILFVPKPTDCSLSPHDSQDLLVTLKGLHQTLSKLVDHLSTGTHDGKHSRNGGGSGGGGGSGSSSGRSGGGSSSLGSLSPPSGNGISRNGGRTSGSNDVRKSSGSGSSSLGSIGGDYPSQDKSSDSGGPVRKNPGQRPFQCAPGYAGSYTRSIHSPEAGISYTSNMLEARWDVETGWAPAFIVPIGNFSLNPSTKALMYGQMVFDSIRANMGYDNRIRLLRPRNHLANLRKAATRMALPDFDDEELLICMKRLVLSDASLIPAPYTNASLEIRVALMGSDSKIEIEPSKSAILYVYMVPHTQVSLLQYTEPRTVYVDPQYARSWPGSLGEYKTSNNYASTMLPTHTAHELGFNDVMYVYGKEEYITGLNDANVFAFIINDLGAQELITPPADGLIVPDVTRKTVLEMARHWGEFLVTERPISIHEIRTLHRQGRLLEMFASNTMANTVPIVSIYYAPKRDIIRVVTLGRQGSLSNRFNRAFQSIENGLVDHPWGLVI